MGQFFGQEILTEIIRVDNSTVRLPSGSYIRLGGQAYRLDSNLDLDTGTIGAGGLESAVQANTVYYVYAVLDSSSVKLIGSTFKTQPSGFVSYKKVGAFITNVSSEVSSAYFLGVNGEKTVTDTQFIRGDNGNGFGSTFTANRRYSNIRRQDDEKFFTYTDSPTDGAVIECKVSGVFDFQISGQRNGPSAVAVCVGTPDTSTIGPIENLICRTFGRNDSGGTDQSGSGTSASVFLQAGEKAYLQEVSNINNFINQGFSVNAVIEINGKYN